MNLLAEFHFIRPNWLLLIPIVVLLWWLVRRSQDPLRGWRAVLDRDLLEAMTVRTKTNQRWRQTSLLAGWLIAMVAVAGPTWRPEPSPFADDPVPVMLVLKAAETMELEDIAPSRMERARLKVADFAEERKGQPLGLVTYAGSAHLVLPPTRDTAVVATMGLEISPAIMPKPGDDLVAAIQTAATALGSDGGSIVVVADTVGQAGDESLFDWRRQNRLPVFFLAVAEPDSAELDTIQQAAGVLNARVTVMTPDAKDVRSLVSLTAKAPVLISNEEDGTRWAESGWWLVPILALFSLIGFRRVQHSQSKEASP